MKALTIIFIMILTTGFIYSDEKNDMNSMEPDNSSMMMMSDSVDSMVGGKISFTTLDDALSMVRSGPVILFFYADWCPTCQSAMKDIDAHIEKLDKVTIVVVNYDKEKDLVKKYGVVYQHTFVQINPAGEKIAIWSGGGVDKILKQVNAGKEM